MPLMAPSPVGLQLVKVEDPTGNGQESYDIVHRNPGSDTLYYARLIVQRFAGQKLRFVHCGPWAGTDTIFETDGSGKVLIVPGP